MTFLFVDDNKSEKKNLTNKIIRKTNKQTTKKDRKGQTHLK